MLAHRKDFVSSYLVPRSPTLRLQAEELIQINEKGITAANAQQSGLGRGIRNPLEDIYPKNYWNCALVEL